MIDASLMNLCRQIATFSATAIRALLIFKLFDRMRLAEDIIHLLNHVTSYFFVLTSTVENFQVLSRGHPSVEHLVKYFAWRVYVK